jgi:hypothetical protein
VFVSAVSVSLSTDPVERCPTFVHSISSHWLALAGVAVWRCFSHVYHTRHTALAATYRFDGANRTSAMFSIPIARSTSEATPSDVGRRKRAPTGILTRIPLESCRPSSADPWSVIALRCSKKRTQRRTRVT